MRPSDLTTQHRHLVPKHDDFQLFESLRTRPKEHELQQAAQRQIAKRPEQGQLLEDQQETGYRPYARTRPDRPGARTELTYPTATSNVHAQGFGRHDGPVVARVE